MPSVRPWTVDSDPADAALTTWGSGSQPSGARRRGNVVLRESSPSSATVSALLRHYEAVGLTGVPQVVGSGFSPDGLETRTYLEGTSPHPGPWPDDALPALGALLRRVHEAGTTFSPPPDAHWAPWFGRGLPGSRPVIGHCDAAPWNALAQSSGGYALIDWEYAGPVDAVWELAQAAWLNAQLHDDDIAERQGLPSAHARARQVRLLLDGYGLARADRVGFVDRLVEFAVRAARAEAVQHQVTVDTAATSDTGFPVLWAVTWRTRSAAWMLDHRALLDDAVG